MASVNGSAARELVGDLDEILHEFEDVIDRVLSESSLLAQVHLFVHTEQVCSSMLGSLTDE